MEFKGTQGKWEVNKHLCIVDENGYGIAQVHGITNDKDWESNALLISKAPEMLEMLQKDIEHLEELAMYIPAKFWTEEFRDNWNKEMHEKEQLIQEATEIN